MSHFARFDNEVTPELVQALARLLRLPTPPEDLAELRDALVGQLELFGKIDSLELGDASPAFQFDPRWKADDDRAP